MSTTSDMQGLVWGEPELAHELIGMAKFEVGMQLLFTVFVAALWRFDFGLWPLLCLRLC